MLSNCSTKIPSAYVFSSGTLIAAPLEVLGRPSNLSLHRPYFWTLDYFIRFAIQLQVFFQTFYAHHAKSLFENAKKNVAYVRPTLINTEADPAGPA